MFVLALAGIAVNLLNLLVLDSHIGHGHSDDHSDGHAHGHADSHSHSSDIGCPLNGGHQHSEAAAEEGGAPSGNGGHPHHGGAPGMTCARRGFLRDVLSHRCVGGCAS